MALISIIEDFHPRIDAGLLARAEALRPALRHEDRLPLPFDGAPLGKGAELLLDFGEHLVGRVTLTLGTAGSHPDAPATVKLFFAETLRELDEDPAAFDGWLSRSWIQEETVHVDELPGLLTLPRRYAFRYLRITVLDTSPKYRLIVEEARPAAVAGRSAPAGADQRRVLPEFRSGQALPVPLRRQPLSGRSGQRQRLCRGEAGGGRHLFVRLRAAVPGRAGGVSGRNQRRRGAGRPAAAAAPAALRSASSTIARAAATYSASASAAFCSFMTFASATMSPQFSRARPISFMTSSFMRSPADAAAVAAFFASFVLSSFTP